MPSLIEAAIAFAVMWIGIAVAFAIVLGAARRFMEPENEKPAREAGKWFKGE